MKHWGPSNPNGTSCRFCENPPFPMLRNSQDAADYWVCHDARFPRFYTKLRGLVRALG